MQRLKILIVDDDPHLVEALNLWLSKYDYEILTAENGDQAEQTDARHCGRRARYGRTTLRSREGRGGSVTQ